MVKAYRVPLVTGRTQCRFSGPEVKAKSVPGAGLTSTSQYKYIQREKNTQTHTFVERCNKKIKKKKRTQKDKRDPQKRSSKEIFKSEMEIISHSPSKTVSNHKDTKRAQQREFARSFCYVCMLSFYVPFYLFNILALYILIMFKDEFPTLKILTMLA